MGYYENFRKFYEELYGPLCDEDYLLSESWSIEEDDMRLGALGSFYVEEATKLDPEVEVDWGLDMDYAEHKNHFVNIYSDVQMGGRPFRVILEDLEYIFGRIADSKEEFDKDSDYVVKRIVSDYHHVLNHVRPDLDPHAYNPAEDPHEC
ncbi:MAG: hypothetical protein HRF40_10625 [Nitrososphaera sp.]|jgi:hypothetical protein